jgi:UDP-N-acetylglucosamine--N-acetylmuramyl-(pentapeptide) pyrophosphoryl-undecaprenol N-acetylglucosamine transferase
MSRRAAAVCVAFDETRARLRGCSRLVTTGTPVREEIAALARTSPRADLDAPMTLLVLGGSQGAAGLNDAVVALLDTIAHRWPRTMIVHQTGPEQYDKVKQAYQERGLAHVVEPFFSDVARWYARATLAISRAGGTTLAELACAGCPAVLVPFPGAVDDHQLRNAELFVRQGAARLVRQTENSKAVAEELTQCLTGMLDDPATLFEMQRSMRDLARPDATRRVIEVVEESTIDETS